MKQRKTIILWLTFLATTATSIFTFAKGYSYSKHEPGFTTDADFWFLLQTCITQGFGLVILCVPLWKDSKYKPATWIPPVVAALICTILAPSLFVFLASEWTAMLAAFGAILQAFVVLQLALVDE